jgi:transcriptional regulator with XRE-family HTH domain
MSAFGDRVRTRRESLRKADGTDFSLRRVAEAVGVSPTFLSRVETGKTDALPSEEVIVKIAKVLGEDPDALLALADRVSSRLKRIIVKRPELFAQLLEELDQLPDHALVRIVREVRDGEW